MGYIKKGEKVMGKSKSKSKKYKKLTFEFNGYNRYEEETILVTSEYMEKYGDIIENSVGTIEWADFNGKHGHQGCELSVEDLDEKGRAEYNKEETDSIDTKFSTYTSLIDLEDGIAVIINDYPEEYEGISYEEVYDRLKESAYESYIETKRVTINIEDNEKYKKLLKYLEDEGIEYKVKNR